MDFSEIAVALLAFFLGGMVKGVVGLGLPTVALAILGTAMGPQYALRLIVLPAFLTNVWQALVGGHLGALLRRMWPLLVAMVPGVALGVAVLTHADPATLDALLGAVLVAYATLGLAKIGFSVAAARERLLGPVVGFATGIAAGATGTLVMPVVPYLSALGLSRDALVQAMGISFAFSTLIIGLIFAGQRVMGVAELGLSAVSVGVAVLGMVAGQALRRRLSPERFRRILFLSLLILGANLIRRGILA